MTERRYTEAEVEAIFARAADADAADAPHAGQRLLASNEGMTLAQLQEIGREVGMSPEAVASAANAIDRAGRPTSRRFLGLTIGVGRTVELGRKLSDEEWERLVVDLRETFDARGRLRSDGSLRQWTNGNLQALLEPSATGHRLRLRTVKGNAMSYMIGGIGMLAAGTLALVIKSFEATGGLDLTKVGILAAIGAGLFAAGALQLPSWARTRRRQMAEIAERLVLSAPSRSGESSGQK